MLFMCADWLVGSGLQILFTSSTEETNKCLNNVIFQTFSWFIDRKKLISLVSGFLCGIYLNNYDINYGFTEMEWSDE